jgi:molybdopterin/thiamine biosynthesis adenylyltransferase
MTATIIGLGNIGSPLVPLLVRLGLITRLILLDLDRYAAGNRSAQAIAPSDVGQPKAIVQAERARRIQPEIQVIPIHDAVENVPPGCLRGNVILGCLDSKYARQHVNQLAWRLGVPWIDAGVRADGLLARVSVYLPGTENACCLECAWSDRDYQTLDIPRPCSGDGAPTNAPAYLGSLAASLQAAECDKLLRGSHDSVNREILVDLATHKLYETSYRRNPRCRFDHHTWTVEPLDARVSVAEALEVVGGALQVEGRSFSTRLRCGCGELKPVVCLSGRLPDADRICPNCGELMHHTGFDSVERLTTPTSQPLSSIGLMPGDLLMAGGNRCLEVTV